MDEALSRRAVACKHWRWMPGMLDAAGSRVESVRDGWITLAGGVEPGVYMLVDMGLPDLSDPATLGCLLALVREAWDAPGASTEPCSYGWNLYRWVKAGTAPDGRLYDGQWVGHFGATEAEALVAALEAAP